MSDNSYHSVVDFIASARGTYGKDLSHGRDEAFVAYMKAQGKFYMRNEREFIPYLKRYLGK